MLNTRSAVPALLAVAALLTVTACAGSAASSDASSPELPAFTVPAEPRDPAAIADELAAAQTLWQAKGLTDYSYTVTARCVACLVDGSSSVVDVEGGIVRREQSSSPLYGDLPGAFDSIDEVLRFIESALELSLVADAAFDPETGFPTFFIFTTEFADQQASFEIAPTGFYYTLR